MSSGNAAPCLLQSFVHVNLGSLHSRNQAEENSRQKRNAECETQHSPIQTDFARPWNSRWADIENELNAPMCNQQSEGASDDSQQHAFSKQLPRDAPTARAQCGATRHLFLPRRGS